jgi:hypothetical protein
MTTPELILAVEAAGGRFRVDGHALFIWPKGAATPWLKELHERQDDVVAYLIARWMITEPEAGRVRPRRAMQ